MTYACNRRGRPIIIDGDVAYIPLTRGKAAIIDAADADNPRIAGWHWCAIPGGREWYAYCGGYRKERLHEVIHPVPAGFVTDHIDHDGLNNRRNNLRQASDAQNKQHTRAYGVVPYKGVQLRRNGRFRARIMPNGKPRVHLGIFDDMEKARHVRTMSLPCTTLENSRC